MSRNELGKAFEEMVEEAQTVRLDPGVEKSSNRLPMKHHRFRDPNDEAFVARSRRSARNP